MTLAFSELAARAGSCRGEGGVSASSADVGSVARIAPAAQVAGRDLLTGLAIVDGILGTVVNALFCGGFVGAVAG